MSSTSSDQIIHCQEYTTASRYSGIFSYSSRQISVKLFDYGQAVAINEISGIFLICSDANHVSLHDCIDGGDGYSRSGAFTVHSHTFYANVAITGPDHWKLNDGIKRCTFQINHTFGLLTHSIKIDSIENKLPTKDDDTLLGRIETKYFDIRIGYTGVWKTGRATPEKLVAEIEIQFKEKTNVNNYFESVLSVTRFMSFCLGAPLRPSEIRIDRLSRKQMLAHLARGTYRRPHDVIYTWSEQLIDTKELWVDGSPVRAWDDEELSSLMACLHEWLSRSQTWRKANILMIKCLESRQSISPDRLLNACRWLEELPDMRPKAAISSRDASAIAKAAADSAVALGYSNAIRERVATAVSRIVEEPAKARHSRIVESIKARFGADVLPHDAADRLSDARRFRGKLAHGHFSPSDETEERLFYRSILAVESICVLITANDLPISNEGLRRMRRHPLVRAFHEALPA